MFLKTPRSHYVIGKNLIIAFRIQDRLLDNVMGHYVECLPELLEIRSCNLTGWGKGKGTSEKFSKSQKIINQKLSGMNRPLFQ
jgi:hypothetical protein